MKELKFVVQISFTIGVSSATSRAARPVVRMASLQLIGIARYSSSLRLAPHKDVQAPPKRMDVRERPLHPTGHTAHAVQLPFLG